MAEHARPSAPAKKAKARRRVRTRRSPDGKPLTPKLAASADPAPVRAERRGKRDAAADPNDASAYFQRLKSLAAQADRGEAVDSTDIADREFLDGFLGR
jgi:hypothetical protein